ncbi:hypothetical protein [Streptomyces sp. NPDC002057]
MEVNRIAKTRAPKYGEGMLGWVVPPGLSRLLSMATTVLVVT